MVLLWSACDHRAPCSSKDPLQVQLDKLVDLPVSPLLGTKSLTGNDSLGLRFWRLQSMENQGVWERETRAGEQSQRVTDWSQTWFLLKPTVSVPIQWAALLPTKPTSKLNHYPWKQSTVPPLKVRRGHLLLVPGQLTLWPETPTATQWVNFWSLSQ